MNEKIKKFFAISGVGAYFKVLVDGLVQQIRDVFPADATEDEIPGAFAKAVEALRAAAEANKFDLVTKAAQVYVDTYSEEEIDALIAFFESPTGKKVVSMGGMFLPAVADVGNEWSANVVNSIRGDIEKILEEEDVTPFAPTNDTQLDLPIEQVTAPNEAPVATASE
jgi:hypothetical protein